MFDGEPRAKIEPVIPETIGAIITVVNAKLDSPEIVRADKDRGVFVLDYDREYGRRRGSRVEVFRDESFTRITFVENFEEITPRHKPSVLVYGYEIDQGAMNLLIERDDADEDIGLLAKRRRQQLRLDGINVPSEDKDELSYIPSESHAQKVLTSLMAMKTFIE